MELITADYRKLQREMHAASDYGTQGHRHADQLMAVRDEAGCNTVLDYGCGPGRLGDHLNHPDWFYEYDPCVEGKEDKPDHVDLVYCGDVLEHIEPELIDNVIADIAKIAKKAAMLVICLEPSLKSLPDGRNAHILLRSEEWWREKIEERFYIATWECNGNQIIMAGGSIYKIEQIVPKSACSDSLRWEQAQINCTKTPERVKDQPRHEGRCALVCYGPSLHHTWRNLVAERRLFGAKIVTVSGAHDFLIERGVVPDIHMDVDPREHKAYYTRNPHPDVEYWIGSCCHPKMIDQLLPYKLKLWHVFNSETDLNIVRSDGPDPGSWLIAGGGSVGCRAFNVMYTVGYRIFSVYGMDCSFDDSGQQHAAVHLGKQQVQCNAKCGDRWFKTSLTLMATAQGFMDNTLTLHRACEAKGEPFIEGTTDYLEIFMHGDGLLPQMYINAMEKQERERAAAA